MDRKKGELVNAIFTLSKSETETHGVEHEALSISNEASVQKPPPIRFV
jgi:hypothetical protein